MRSRWSSVVWASRPIATSACSGIWVERSSCSARVISLVHLTSNYARGVAAGTYERAYVLVGACESRTRVCSTCGAVRPRAVLSAAGCVVYVDIGARAPNFTRVCVWYGVRRLRRMALCLMCDSVRSESILKLASRILSGYAYGTALGTCSPSSAHLCTCVHVRRSACATRAVYLSSRVRLCVRVRRSACTDRVLVAQKCACVCLHSVRRVPSERCTYRVQPARCTYCT